MTDQLIAVAGATVECLHCQGGVSGNLDTTVVPPSFKPCVVCKEGRVPALPDVVRVKCPCRLVPVGAKYHKIYPGEPDCQGRGWNPSTDLAVWMGVVRKSRPSRTAGTVLAVITAWLYGLVDRDLLDVVVSALGCALVAQGAKLGDNNA